MVPVILRQTITRQAGPSVQKYNGHKRGETRERGRERDENLGQLYAHTSAPKLPMESEKHSFLRPTSFMHRRSRSIPPTTTSCATLGSLAVSTLSGAAAIVESGEQAAVERVSERAKQRELTVTRRGSKRLQWCRHASAVGNGLCLRCGHLPQIRKSRPAQAPAKEE